MTGIRVVMVAGADRTGTALQAALAARDWLQSNESGSHWAWVNVAVVPPLWPGDSTAFDRRTWPPEQGYYDSEDDPESRYLWRWLGSYGADVVLDIREGAETRRVCTRSFPNIGALRTAGLELANADPQAAADRFIIALSTHDVGGAGNIPGLRLTLPDKNPGPIIELLKHFTDLHTSKCRTVLAARLRRAPWKVAENLADHYGKSLEQIAYIPALGVLGRLRIARRFDDREAIDDVQRLLAPYRTGERSPVPKSGSEQAGHLLFAELAKTSQGEDRARWIELCRAAADQAFDDQGRPLPLMPFHTEMSDAFFMATPILCATGALTGETRYWDAATSHVRGMRRLCLRDDGLLRHSPLDEAAWGRGNGFGAVGLAWSISELPAELPLRAELIDLNRRHLRALLRHQHPTGCWHQVIDHPESYREYTCTCMISWAMLRGIQGGWLDADEFLPAARLAWWAVSQRTADDGQLVDVCAGTGKQSSLRAYLDRPAILGIDARGGAMALLLANEWDASKLPLTGP